MNFVFTCGDINGIGPEIVLKCLNRIVSKKKQDIYYFICPANVFKKISSIIKPEFDYLISTVFRKGKEGMVTVLSTGNTQIERGVPTTASGHTAYTAIELSFALLKNNYADAVITAPVSKTAMSLAGSENIGHTEMYAGWCGVKEYAMVFLSGRINACPATIHQPLGRVPHHINMKRLNLLHKVLTKALTEDLGIKEPSIAVLGLNPHAGENGLIGKEEEKVIRPFIQENSNYFSGPYSPDAFFANELYKNFDMVLGMYHDQVLIPFKLLNFKAGVNYTAGLPVVRISPDHGTAYDLAWKNMASEQSIYEAFRYAEKIVKNRRRNARSGKADIS